MTTSQHKKTKSLTDDACVAIHGQGVDSGERFAETPVWDALVVELGDPFAESEQNPDESSPDGSRTPADGDYAPDSASSVPEHATANTLAESGATAEATNEP